MKRSFHRILCFLLVILMIPIFSLTALAADDSVVLKAVHFDIALQEDGSAYVTETKEFVYSGDREFTRYAFNNFFAGPREFWGWQASIDGEPLEQLDEPDNDKRPENTFAVESGDGENNIYIYYRQKGSGTRVFEISYWVENAVKLYSDVAEFSWNLTSKNGDVSDVSRLTATLIVPEGVPEEEFRIWAHGPLNGTFEKQSDSTAFLQIDNVPFGTLVDVRCTLPVDCFTGGWEQQGEWLNTILAEEKELANSANATREEEERLRAEREAYLEEYWAKRNAWEAEHPVLSSIERCCQTISDTVWSFVYEYWEEALFAILFAPLLLGFLGVFRLFRKIKAFRLKRKVNRLRHTPSQSPRYYRDLPDDRPAPAVDRLVHFYEGSPNVSRQIPSAMLELNLKKRIRFRTVEGNAVIMLNKQAGEEPFPHCAPREAVEQGQVQAYTPDYQEILWNFLLGAAGESGQISMDDLKEYIKNNRGTAVKFRKDFERAVERESAERIKTQEIMGKSAQKRKHRWIFPAVIGILSFAVRMLSTLYDGVHPLLSLRDGLIAFVAAAILAAIFRALKKYLNPSVVILEQQSEDDLALWSAFGRFLDDFTTFEDKELPEFSVWREYMVYAVAMGRGQKVSKALAVKYPEAFCQDTNDFCDDDFCRWAQDTSLFDTMDSIGRDVAEVREPSSSGGGSWSDGDGGGGGFSDSGGGSDSGNSGILPIKNQADKYNDIDNKEVYIETIPGRMPQARPLSLTWRKVSILPPLQNTLYKKETNI